MGEASPQLQTISEEYFEETYTRGNDILQSMENPQLAEDLQRLLMVCQLLKRSRQADRQRNEELLSEIRTLGEQLMQAMRTSEEDKLNIQRLKMEIDRAWRERDMAQSRDEVRFKVPCMKKFALYFLPHRRRRTNKWSSCERKWKNCSGKRINSLRPRMKSKVLTVL